MHICRCLAKTCLEEQSGFLPPAGESIRRNHQLACLGREKRFKQIWMDNAE